MTQARNLSLFADNVSSSGTVAVAGINATGTPSSTTYLRGDGTWTTIATNAISNGTSNVTVNSSGGTVTVATAGSTALNVDTSQNVGVNAGMLFVSNSSGNTQFRTGISTNASLSAGEGIEFLTTASSSTRVLSYDRTASAFRVLDLAGSSIRISPNNSTSVIVNQYGLGLGATSPSSGTGIAFPATQSASSDANTLDDYEEGTWTPVYSGGVTGVTYGSVQAGYYRKIGSQVTILFGVMTNGLTVTTSGLTITGLPFTSASGSGSNGTVNISNATRWVSSPPIVGAVNTSATSIVLYNSIGATGAGVDPVEVTTGNMSTGSGNRNLCFGTATYFV